MIRSVHATLGSFGEGASANGVALHPPAVPVKKSVTPDFIVCLEDGKKLKMLKRYLRSRYGLTPDAYRSKWNLPADYPMVAPNYAKRRSDFAKQIGLGKNAPPKKRKK
jgi:predicted transcriptional regulator